MEIEVGEYVRTREGYIGKLIDIDESVMNYYTVDTKRRIRHDNFPQTCLYLDDGDISTHSFNIIDLIEVGDYVNGEKVTEIKEWTSSKEGTFRYAITLTYDLIKQEDIKSILTKKQYSSNCYRLEE